MESRRFIPFLILFALVACSGDGSGLFNNSGSGGASTTSSSGPIFGTRKETNYWHPKFVTADNTPDIIKAQDILEEDLTACGYEAGARNYMAKANDPVSTDKGHVVDNKGSPRRKTPLPTSYTVRECMEGRGWVKLKNYYTTPY